MKRVWFCRNVDVVLLVLAETEAAAREAAFEAWNDDPDEVRDITDAASQLLGPLVALARERVPAHDGSGVVFRFGDPARAISYWLGDTADVCPTCSQALALGDGTRTLEPLIDTHRRHLAEIGRLTAANQQLREELDAKNALVPTE